MYLTGCRSYSDNLEIALVTEVVALNTSEVWRALFEWRMAKPRVANYASDSISIEKQPTIVLNRQRRENTAYLLMYHNTMRGMQLDNDQTDSEGKIASGVAAA